MNNILNTANDIINGERKEDYGDAFDSFDRIAGLWSSYLDHHISPVDVAHMMILMKVSRGTNHAKFNKIHEDNLVDIAGYSALAYQVSENFFKDEAARNVKDDEFEMACKCHPSFGCDEEVEEKDSWDDNDIEDIKEKIVSELKGDENLNDFEVNELDLITYIVWSILSSNNEDEEKKDDKKKDKKNASFQDILNDILKGLSEDE